MTADLHVRAQDASALLRAHAFAHDRTVDDIAQALIDRVMNPNGLGRILN